MSNTTRSTDSLKHRKSEGRGEDVASCGITGVYHGTVTGYLKGSELFMVKTSQEGRSSDHKCVWAAGFFSNLMGFNINFAPTIGTDVIIFVPEGGTPYIIGSAPNSHYIDRTGLNRRLTTGGEGELENCQYGTQQFFPKLRQHWGEGDIDEYSSNTFNYGGMPAGDLLEGEIDIQNAMGVGLGLIRHFAILKAGDLAKVEASVIDDMVRIVSHTFRHFSSFGDYKIINDGGRLNVIWDGTTNDWEAAGKDDESDERATLAKKDIIDIEKDKFKNEARWRFSSYIGFLGDFINLFVTDKLKVTSPEEHMERSGKGRIHINEDGSFLAQSVNDIILERVCRIPVPLQKKPEHDPDGNGPELVDGELPFPSDKEPIKCWDWDKSGGVDKSFWCVFQLRDYGRWFSNYYSKARFQQLTKDWEVPSEAAVPKPFRVDDEEKDKREANQGIAEGPVTHDEVYSAIRLYRDGSVSLSDGFENTITMSRNGITVSSSTDLQLEAAGSVNIVAGRDVNLVGRNSTDISALRGGVSIRGENWIQQFSKGGILIESESYAGGTIWNDDAIDYPDSDQEDQYKIGGICLWAKNSSMRLISAADMGLRTDYGKQIFAGFHQIWKSDMPMVFNDQLALIGEVTLVKNLLWSDMHIVKDLYSGNLVEIFGIPVHVLGDTIDVNKLTGPSDTKAVEIFDSAKEISSAFKERDWHAKFKYRTRAEMGTESESATSNQSIYESLTQQGLRLGAENKDLKPGDSYESWNLPQLAELTGRRAAWPGIGKKHWRLPSPLGDTKLWEPSGSTTFKNNSNPLTLSAITLKRLL